MLIYPAIDILDGRVVRLVKGDFNQVTDYGSPFDVVKTFKSQGCKRIHLVDLNGARNKGSNLGLIKDLVKLLDQVQVGGGIRDLKTAETYLSLGVSQVILGTSAIKNQDLLKTLIKKYPGRVTVGVDAKDGLVSVDGWLERTSVKADSFIRDLEGMGVQRIVYTDISRDGMMTGPNFKMYKKVKRQTQLEVIASGGIGSYEDIEELRRLGLDGAVLGRALYEGEVLLKEVL